MSLITALYKPMLCNVSALNTGVLVSVSGHNSADWGNLVEKQTLLAWQSSLSVGPEDRVSRVE